MSSSHATDLYQSRKKWGRSFNLVLAVAHVAGHARRTRVGSRTGYIANRLHGVRSVWHQSARWRAIDKLVAFRHAGDATSEQRQTLRIIERNIRTTGDHAVGIRHEHGVHMANCAAETELRTRLDQTTGRVCRAVCRLNAFLAKANERGRRISDHRIDRFSVDCRIDLGIAAATARCNQHSEN